MTDDQRRCKNCKWWGSEPQPDDYYDLYQSLRKDCDHPKCNDGRDPDGAVGSPSEGWGSRPIDTGPEFFCPHFEAKEEG